MIRKKCVYVVATMLVLGSGIILCPGTRRDANACTSGVAGGEVTEGARPLLWKSRLWGGGGANEVRYFVAAKDNDQDGTPDKYSYLGVESAEVRPDGNLILPMMGVNSAGVATAHNLLFNTADPSDRRLNGYVLGNISNLDQLGAYYKSAPGSFSETQDLHMYLDRHGAVEIWENTVKCIGPGKLQKNVSLSECVAENQPYDGTDYQYRTTAASRDKQWLDAFGFHVNLSGWVVRANHPPHANTDGSDDMNNPQVRDTLGRNAVARLVLRKQLAPRFIFNEFMRNAKIATSGNVSSMVVQGVLPSEDPRLTTLWIAMGQSRTAVAVPLWVHGVEALPKTSRVTPAPLQYDPQNKINSLACLADTLYKRLQSPPAGQPRVSLSDLQARTLPFEAHLFSAVEDTLLPEWRKRNWSDPKASAAVGQQMLRVQDRMARDALSLLKDLYQDLANLKAPANNPPQVDILSISATDLQVQVQTNLADIPVTGTPHHRDGILIDFSQKGGAVSQEQAPVAGRRWNTVGSKDKGTSASLKDQAGKDTGIKLEIIDAFAGDTDAGEDAGVLYPAAAQKDGFFVGEGSGYKDKQAQLKLSGLDPGKSYDFNFFGSRNSGSHLRVGYFTIGQRTAVLDSQGNTRNRTTIQQVVPNAQGVVLVNIDNGQDNGAFAYLSVLEINLHDAAIKGGGNEPTTLSCEYGDGQPGAAGTSHKYQAAGRYLISCTATDKQGVSQTDWAFVTVPASSQFPDAALKDAGLDASTGPGKGDDEGCNCALNSLPVQPSPLPLLLLIPLVVLTLQRRVR